MAHEPGFLGRLAAEDLAALETASRRRRFARGEMAIAESDSGRDVFFVVEGSARATIFAEDGKVVAYRDIGVGEIFGELAAIDGAPRSASVVALSDLVVMRLTHDAFLKLVETRPGFNRAVLSHLVRQSRAMTARIFEYSTMAMRRRLLSELIRLADATGDSESAALAPAPTHFDLAARISSHREAVSREMSRLAKAGLLRKEEGRLLLLDLKGLAVERERAVTD